ncbi:MAG TPA: STAS domain-containing protein [Blastocatellia bacterium]|jgi:ABC-type transporter Mla MlaB component
MLRISEANIPGEGTALRLEGEMIGPWVEEVRKACEPYLNGGSCLMLDLADISFIDRSGIALLKELLYSQVRLVNCSSFITEQLKENGNELQSE